MLRGIIIGSWAPEVSLWLVMSAVLIDGAGIGADIGTVWFSLTVAFGINRGSGGSEIRVVSFLGVTGFWIIRAGVAGVAGIAAAGAGAAGAAGAVGATGAVGIAGAAGRIGAEGSEEPGIPGGFGGKGRLAAEGGVGSFEGTAGAAGMLGWGGVGRAPGGLVGRGSLPAGGGTDNLPGGFGGIDGIDGVAGPAFSVAGGVADPGSLICMVVRESSSTVGVPGRLMRMVSRSRLWPDCEGRLMRMVSFLVSPIRTVSFFTPPAAWGRVIRMVSLLPSDGDAPGLGGRVMRTVAFFEGLGSGDAGEVSAAIIGPSVSHRARRVSTLGSKKSSGKVHNFCLLVFSPIFSFRR